MILYNKKLDEQLFTRWIEVTDKEKFCKDGLMLKYGYTPEFVDEQWGKARRRVLFLVKDNPDGWGHDTRRWLVEGEEAKHSRNLRGGRVGRSGFLPNLAKILYGLLNVTKENPIGNAQVEQEMDEVRETFNTAPFALVEAKKIAGSKSVSEAVLEKSLERDKEFLREELDILCPNIIICCDAGDTQFNYVTQYYLSERTPIKYEYQYENTEMSCCLWYYPSENLKDRIVVAKSYHLSTLGKEKWAIYERVISPFRRLLKEFDF